MDAFLQPSLQQQQSTTATTCPHCQIHLDSAESLSIHIIRMHTVAPIMQGFPCRYCEKVYSTESNLLAHQSTHMGLMGATAQQFTSGQLFQSNLYGMRPTLPSAGNIITQQNTAVSYSTIPSYTSSQNIYAQGGTAVGGMSLPVIHMDGINSSSLQYKDATHESTQHSPNETRDLFPGITHSRFDTYSLADIGNNSHMQKAMSYHSNPPVTSSSMSNSIFHNLDLGLSSPPTTSAGQFYTNTLQEMGATNSEISSRDTTQTLISGTGPSTTIAIPPSTHGKIAQTSQASYVQSYDYQREQSSIQDISASILPSDSILHVHSSSQATTDVTFSGISPHMAPTHLGQSSTQTTTFPYHKESLNQSEGVSQNQRLDKDPASHLGPTSSVFAFDYQPENSRTQDPSINIQSNQRSTHTSTVSHSNSQTSSQVTYQTENSNVAGLSTDAVQSNQSFANSGIISHLSAQSSSQTARDENSNNQETISLLPDRRINQDMVSHLEQSSSQTSVLTLPYQSNNSLPSLPTILSRSSSTEKLDLETSQNVQLGAEKEELKNNMVQAIAETDTNSGNCILTINPLPTSTAAESIPHRDELQYDNELVETNDSNVEDLERSMKQHWASVEKQITPSQSVSNLPAENKKGENSNDHRKDADSIVQEETSSEPNFVGVKDEIMAQNCDPDKIDKKRQKVDNIAGDDGFLIDSDHDANKQKTSDAQYDDDEERISADHKTKQTIGEAPSDDGCVVDNPSIDHEADQDVLSQNEVDVDPNENLSDIKAQPKNDMDMDVDVSSQEEVLYDREDLSINKEEAKHELTCTICNQVFKTNGGLKRHKTVKHKNSLTKNDKSKSGLKKHSCVTCQRDFQTLAELNKHKRSHKGTKGLQGRRKLRSNVGEQSQVDSGSESESSNTVEKLSCAECKKSFKNVRALNMHKVSHRRSAKVQAKPNGDSLETVGDGEKDTINHLSCKECGKTFKTKRGLACHEDIHKGEANKEENSKEEQTTCDMCEITFKSKKELSEHNKTHHKVQRKKRTSKSRERCHKCSTCSKGFLERSHLKEHEKRHGEADIPCPHCDKKFKFVTDLRKHQRSHSDNKPYICPICGNTFKAASHLVEHELRHGETKFACQYCGKRYHVEREMKKHEKIHTNKIHQCPHCEDEFKEKTTLQDHIREHEQKGTVVVKQFMCTHCNLYFSSEKGLLHHLNNKHRQLIKPEDRWQFICDFCKRVCQTEEALKLHKKLHKGDRIFPCSKCDKFFKSGQHLREHEKRHGEANLSCKICDWKFVLAVDLRKHEKRHAMNKSLSCKYCEKKFSTNGALNAHIKRHTQSASSFVCTHCKLGFRSNLGLKYHQNHKHLEKLPPSARWTHLCDHCNMVFPTLSAMLRHKNMQGKYTCQICNLGVRTEKAFKLHQQIHLGLRNHCCPVCKKGFKKAHHLAEHMKRHTEGKHPCKMCGKKYVFLTDLRKHINLSHLSSKLISCTQCEKKFPSERMLRQHVMLHHQAPVEKQHVCYDCNLQFSGAKGLLSHMNNKHRDKLTEKDKWKFQCQKCQRMFRSTKALEVHDQVHSDIRPHECTQCGKRFKEARHLMEHTKRHGEGQYPCPKCDKKYVFERDLVKHIKTHNEVKEFVCTECGKGFAKNSDLNAHLMRHEQAKKDPTVMKVKPLQCSHCTLTFVHKKGLDTHMNNKHRDELEEDERWPYWCSQCKKAFRTKTALKKHEPEHLGRRDYICEVCKKSFKEARHLTEHQKRHNKPTLECSKCDKKYVFERDLLKHEKTHSEERPFKCPKCVRQYGLKSALDTHMKIHEQTHAKYVCQFCTLGFTSNICLMNHLNNNHRDEISEEDRWNHICKYCSKSYPNEQGLLKHERVHRNLKVHCCNICGKHFKLAHHLTQHEKRHQEGELPCQYCHKKYVFASDLRKHVRIHTGEKPFCCEYCGKRFRVSGGLRKHLRLHEQRKKVAIPKPHKCKSCKKSFRLKDKLTNHMKVHEEKQYACTVCPKKFCFEKTLQRHLLTHSTIKPFACNICPRQFVEEVALNRHVKKHENGLIKPKVVKTSQVKNYVCDHCTVHFVTDYKKNYHMNMKHRDLLDPSIKWAHVCSDCSRPFATGRALHKHSAIHSNQIIFPCLLCQKHFKTLQELNEHDKCHLQQQPPSQLVHHHQQLHQQQPMQQHQQVQQQQHPQQQVQQQHVFMCKFCNRGFLNPMELRQHESSHTTDTIVTVPLQGDLTYNQDGGFNIQVALCDATGYDTGNQQVPGRTDGQFELLAELISATNNILTLNN